MSRADRNIKQLESTKTKPSGHRVVIQTTSPTDERKTFKKTFRGENSLQRAREYRDKIERKLETGEIWRELKLQEMKIGEYVLTTYLPRIRDRNTKNDANQKASAAKKYLPKFGETAITDLRAADIEEWIYDLETQESKHGRRYSTETIKKYVQCFRTVVTEMCNRYGLRNPFDRVTVKPRQIRGRERKRKVATEEEIQTLHQGLRKRVEEARSKKTHRQWLPKREVVLHIFKVQLLTGCRSSELFFLRKEHVLRDTEVIVVEGAVVDGEPGWTKAGKLANDRKKGIRRVPVSPAVIETIDHWLERREALGFPDTDTIVTTVDGDYLRATNLRNQYKKACRAAKSDQDDESGDVREITPHMLRHTLNDLLRRQGTQRLARQAILGHADADTNVNYTNPQAEEARDELGAVADIIDFEEYENDTEDEESASTGSGS